MLSAKALLVIGFLAVGCTKLIEVDPPIESITAQDVYKDNKTAASVLTGLYINMGNASSFSGQASISVYAGFS